MTFRNLMAVALLAVLSAPLVLTAALGPEKPSDNLAPARYPDLPRHLGALAIFPLRFEGAFDRTFRGRGALVKAWSRVVFQRLDGAKLNALSKTPQREVFQGADGELFYGGDRSVESHRAADTAALRVSVEAWAAHLGRHGEALRARGVRHLVVIAPDKQSIYDEQLPRWARNVGTPAVELLAGALRAQGKETLDLREPLRRAARDARVYYRHDSHWNELGACVAAREIQRTLSVEPVVACDAERSSVQTRGGDLALMLGLQDALTEASPLPAASARATREAEAWRGRGTTRARLVGDSFAAALAPYLAAGFAELVDTKRWPADAGEVDIVIEEIVERRLAMTPVSD